MVHETQNSGCTWWKTEIIFFLCVFKFHWCGWCSCVKVNGDAILHWSQRGHDFAFKSTGTQFWIVVNGTQRAFIGTNPIFTNSFSATDTSVYPQLAVQFLSRDELKNVSILVWTLTRGIMAQSCCCTGTIILVPVTYNHKQPMHSVPRSCKHKQLLYTYGCGVGNASATDDWQSTVTASCQDRSGSD